MHIKYNLYVQMHLSSKYSDFIQATDMAAQLMEMSSIGGNFTWTNNSVDSNFKQTRLDRALTNQHWIDTQHEARLEFFSGASDHKGMIVTFYQMEKGRKLPD